MDQYRTIFFLLTHYICFTQVYFLVIDKVDRNFIFCRPSFFMSPFLSLHELLKKEKSSLFFIVRRPFCAGNTVSPVHCFSTSFRAHKVERLCIEWSHFWQRTRIYF